MTAVARNRLKWLLTAGCGLLIVTSIASEIRIWEISCWGYSVRLLRSSLELTRYTPVAVGVDALGFRSLAYPDTSHPPHEWRPRILRGSEMMFGSIIDWLMVLPLWLPLACLGLPRSSCG